MSFTVIKAPSTLAKEARRSNAATAAETDDKVEKVNRREDHKKQKELEEARKAGTVPAMKDEEGKDINPHIPQYIMQAPWYIGAEHATLKHQKLDEQSITKPTTIGNWYRKGVRQGPTATKYRKGACTNCGAMTHKKIDCLERPRKIGAEYTGAQIAPDEHLQPQMSFDYDGKRDQWNGYDLSNYKTVARDFENLEKAKRQLKADQMDDKIRDQEKEKEEDGDELKYADEMDMPGQKFETKQRITVRNLRIREDTAKYLFNLDPNSAYYDPKTRSMRENPLANTGKAPEDLPYAGDNFVRYSGDSTGMSNHQVFAWQAYEKGTDVHLQADPTKLAVLANQFKKNKAAYKEDIRDGILQKYGGQEHLDAPPKELLLAQTENYVEYSRKGQVIKGNEKVTLRSRYLEDQFPSNHKSIFGSFWKNGEWGYKCCHQTVKGSYCIGHTGVAISNSSTLTAPTNCASELCTSKSVAKIDESSSSSSEEDEVVKKKQKLAKKAEKRRKRKAKRAAKKAAKKKKKRKETSSCSDSSSSSSESEDGEKKVQKAILAERLRVQCLDKTMSIDERKRPYNCMHETKEPSEAELEAYRRTRVREDDPMAKYI